MLGQIADVHGAEFSQNDEHLLIWDLNGKAQVLDTNNWDTVKTYEFNKPIKSGVFSRKGNSILICIASVWHWKYQEGRLDQINDFDSCEGAVFSQDDKRVLVWNENTAQVLNLEDSESVTLQENQVKGAMFINSRVLTWSGNAARLWGVQDGKPLTPVLKHDGPINGIILSGDQQQIMTWSDDATVRLWRISEYDGSSSELLLAHEIRTGSVLDSNKNIKLLSAEEWLDRKKKMPR
jgi:WD40 repeat protein